MAGLTFRVLGPLSVHRDPSIGQAVPSEITVAGARRRSLLIRLIVSPNAQLSAARLVEDIWDGSPPPGAASTLQSHISLLRKILGPERIATTGGRYSLVVDDNEIDYRLFEIDAAEGRDAWRDDDPERAAAAFGRALERWSGEALADVATARWAVADAARLEELKIGCLEGWLRCRSELGDNDAVVAGAESAIASHPFREGLWTTLMLALYRSGRQSDALRTFQRLSRTLGEELGIVPGPEAAALEVAILRQSPDLDVTVRAASSGPGLGGGRTPFLRRVVGTFVGRSAEQETIGRSWEDCRRLGRGVVLIGGEPGIGKTKLALRAAQQVEDDAAVLYGRCEEGGMVPYQPFAEAFSRLESTPDGVGPGTRSGLTKLAEPFAGDWPRGAVDWNASETGRYRLFEAVERWFAQTLNGRPALLVVDDLQWADRATVKLLEHLVRSDESFRLLVVAIFRDADLGDQSPLLPAMVEWQAGESCRRIRLEGFSVDEVHELLEAGSDGAGTNTFFSARQLHDLTEGNPFFAQQLLRTAAAMASPSSMGDAVARPVPGGIRDLVLWQTGRLNPPGRELVGAAAACSGEFEFSLIRAVTELSESDLLAGVESALRAQLVAPVAGTVDRYRFAHALVRQAIYEQLSPSRAARLHNRLAVALEASIGAQPAGDELAELATQFLAGSSVADGDKAVRYAVLAADAAMEQFAYETAADALDRAIKIEEANTGSPEVLPDLLIRLGQARTRAGEVAAGKVALVRAAHLAESMDRPDLLAAAAIAYGGPVSIAWEPDDEHLDLLERALGTVADIALEARLRARLAQSVYYTSDRQQPDVLSAEAVALARATGDQAVLAECLIYRLWAIYGPDRVELCRDLAREVIALGESLGDPEVRLGGAQCLVHASLELGDLAAARQAATIQEEAAIRLRQPHYFRLSEINAAMTAILEGRFAEGERLAEEARSHSLPRGQGEAFIVFAAQICASYWLQGRLGELRPVLENAYADEPGRAVWQAALCWIHAESGSAASARPFLDELLDRPFESLPLDLRWWPTMVGATLATSALADRAAATRLWATLAPFQDRLATVGQTAVLGSTHHYLGLLAAVMGDVDGARAHLTAAADRHAAIGSPPLKALSQVALARFLTRQGQGGDGDVVRRLVTEAADTAARYSMAVVARQCRELAGQGWRES